MLLGMIPGRVGTTRLGQVWKKYRGVGGGGNVLYPGSNYVQRLKDTSQYSTFFPPIASSYLCKSYLSSKELEYTVAILFLPDRLNEHDRDT